MVISEKMPVYKNKPAKKPRLWNVQTLSEGANESKLEINLHTGTHFDAPLHLIEGGKTTDQLFSNRFVFNAQVLDLTNVKDAITAKDLESKFIEERHFVLLKTKNSNFDQFEPDFVYLEKTAAELLVKKKAVGVGIDALGIERNQPDHATHKILFEHDALILEGLRLKNAKEGKYLLVAAPLSLEKTEAAPCRAFLISEGSQ